MNLSQAQLSRLENGPGLRDLDRLVDWALLLGMPAEMLWFALPSSAPAQAQPGPDGIALPFVHALRAVDREVGGAHLYATVAAHLAQYPSALPSSGASSRTHPRSESVASLAEMAGWMALESGARTMARRHLSYAVASAVTSGDSQLAAQVCASLSHFARQDGNAHDAVAHAEAGLVHLRNGPPHGPLEARLQAVRASGLAAGGRPVEAVAAITAAETAFQGTSVSSSHWLSPFDEASLASEAARCFLQVGDFAEAARQLHQALAGRKHGRVRSRALAQITLATALLGQGRPDEACTLVREVLAYTTNLGSAVLLDRLKHVALLLRSHTERCSDVPELIGQLRQAVLDRAWIGTTGALHDLPAVRRPQ
ncbi:tetratricopeptide repeat protein [Plantactinospora sp. KLBMP9567]|uniref:tetratricopeptide repeat protein n=1 Tax=Plantactinospora sp. KLBMP9567 TaxID=3085900 RepID=UPI0029827CA6|nr:DNA-binding protein [Plantactinospora sp. KLBMP9567]MDW5324971.1 DNA-binding protein [Plantactinospora sp. KLBMP9567]